MPLEATTEPPFGHIQRQIGKLMDQVQKGFYTFSPGETWTPNVNLYESETSYIVCVDLAGVVKDGIDLQVHRQYLTLKGNRAVPTHSGDGAPDPHHPKCRVHLMEIDHGPFIREVELPENVESDQISAKYRDGMLWIELPKKK